MDTSSVISKMGVKPLAKEYNLKYLDLFRNDIVVPIVRVHCEYKRILRYGHKIRIETTYTDSAAAKLLFQYTIYDVSTNEIVATGNSVQVFMHKEPLELMLTLPQFMIAWKKKWLTD